MKRLVLALFSVSLIFALFTPSTFAQKTKTLQIHSEPKFIQIIKPYVEVTKEGKIQFKENVPKKIYDTFQLEKLQLHFDHLNSLSQQDYIVINKDLSIKNKLYSPSAVYGKWTYHWWGYDRNFNNEQTLDAIDYYNTVAAGGAIATGATFWLPPVAGILGASSGYFYLVATRFNANNQGNGVYAAVSWLAVFDISPL